MKINEIIANKFNIDISNLSESSILNEVYNYDMFINCVNKFGIGKNNIHIYEDDLNRFHFILAEDHFRIDVAKVLDYRFIGEFLYQLSNVSKSNIIEDSNYIAVLKKL